MAYSFFDLADDVLKDAKTPLTFQQIWEQATSFGFSEKVRTKGKTPWNTLGSRLYVDVRDKAASCRRTPRTTVVWYR
ncbi:winged helix-turn-helix domain-containing protein [Candidatus Hydrogenedentota bacterium]